MAGAHVRLWRYQRAELRLQLLWGSDAMGEWAQYKDVGREQDGRDLERHFGKMKGAPPTSRADQGDSYGDIFPTTRGQGLSNPSCMVPSACHQMSAFSYTAGPASGRFSTNEYLGTYATTPSPVILESSHPSLPANAIEVQVTYRVIPHKKRNEYMYRFAHGRELREVPYHE